VSKMGLEEAKKITKHWNDLCPNPDSWLRLGQG